MIWRTVAKGERLESARNGHFTIEHVGGQHLGGEAFLVELLAQLEVLDVVKSLMTSSSGP